MTDEQCDALVRALEDIIDDMGGDLNGMHIQEGQSQEREYKERTRAVVRSAIASSAPEGT